MEEKKLYRSVNDKKISGVCGGLGTYFNVDPILFRVLFLTFLLTTLGIILYIVMAIAINPDPDPAHVYSGARIYRSTTDKKLAGVCGGLAKMFGWDVGVVRLATALICLFGIGLLPYIFAWILIPKDVEVV